MQLLELSHFLTYALLAPPLVVSCYLLVPHVLTLVWKQYFRAKAAGRAEVVLSFDDGPDPAFTPAILDLLDSHGLRGYFFLVGKRVEQHPAIVAEILRRGHQIGRHGYNHLHPWRTGPFSTLIDLLREDRVFAKIPGAESIKLYRPPYGKFNLISLIYSCLTRRSVFFWTEDPKDYASPSAAVLAPSILSRMRPGSVVLLHDGRFGKAANTPNITVNALATALPHINTIDRTPDERLRPRDGSRGAPTGLYTALPDASK